MAFVTEEAWQKYRDIINSVHDDFNKDILIWRRNVPVTIPLFNESPLNEYQDINLKVLIAYNYFRTWPITRHTNTGELDNQNMAVYINRKYLQDLGYTTDQGYFNFRPDKDIFVHRGIHYKCEGDTLIAQAGSLPLLIQLILRREEIPTGSDLYNQP